MQITDQKAVTIHYTLKDDAGEVLDSSRGRDPLNYLQGAGNIVPGLEKALAGKAAGATLQVTLAPEEAYGPRDDGNVRNVPLRKLSADGKVTAGDAMPGPDGGRRSAGAGRRGSRRLRDRRSQPPAGGDAAPLRRRGDGRPRRDARGARPRSRPRPGRPPRVARAERALAAGTRHARQADRAAHGAVFAWPPSCWRPCR